MATSAQNIVDRAVARHVANRSTSLLPADAVTLERIDTAQHALFVRLAGDNRTYWQRSTAVTSTAVVSSGARTADLSAIAPPVLRVLRVRRTLDGREVLPIDLQHQDDAWGPRYTTAGLTLTEVIDTAGHSWSPGTTAALSLTVDYVAGPTALDLAGADLSEEVSVPDAFADILVNRYAAFLHVRDVGRDPAELATLDAEYERRYGDFVGYVDALAGAFTRGATPSAPERKT